MSATKYRLPKSCCYPEVLYESLCEIPLDNQYSYSIGCQAWSLFMFVIVQDLYYKCTRFFARKVPVVIFRGLNPFYY